jgi:hypothetical protein
MMGGHDGCRTGGSVSSGIRSDEVDIYITYFQENFAIMKFTGYNIDHLLTRVYWSVAGMCTPLMCLMIDIDVLFSDGRTRLAGFKFLIVVLLNMYSFLGYNVVSLGEWFQTFQRIMVLSSSRSGSLLDCFLKMSAPQSFDCSCLYCSIKSKDYQLIMK